MQKKIYQTLLSNSFISSKKQYNEKSDQEVKIPFYHDFVISSIL